MSSEVAGGSGARPRRFRTTVVAAVTALVVAVVALTIANVTQGPRLLGTEINPTLTVERTRQRLVLRLDQAVVKVGREAVTVTPAVPFELLADSAALTLRFDTALPYATTYTVSIPVRSAATGASATVTYSFRTPDPVVYLLRRQQPTDGGTVDQIVRMVVGGAEQVVDEAPRIQEYAVTGGMLAVVTTDEAGVGELTIKPVLGGTARTVVRGTSISQLQAVSPAGLFGFVTVPPDASESHPAQLQVYDPSAPDRLKGVIGFDGKPLAPQTWAFVPGTSSLIAQDSDAVFYLIDPLGGSAIRPLGAHLVLQGFINNSTTALFQDPNHFSTINLSNGRTGQLPAVALGRTAGINRLFPLPGKDRYVGLEVSLKSDRLHYRVVSVVGHSVEPLFTPRPEGTFVPSMCLSPNGQYLAVQTVPPGTATDGYPSLPGYLDPTTALLDTTTGTSQTVRGFAASWCN